MRAIFDIKQRLTNSRLGTPSISTSQNSLGGGKAWSVWLASTIFVLFQFFLQLSSGEIVEGLMKSFALTAFGGGVLASAYYYIYVALQTPGGMLVDRFGPRRLLSMGALGVVFGALLFGLSGNLLVAVIGRLLMGAGAAFAFVGSMNLIGKWFPAERFGLMASIVEMLGMLATLIGGALLAVVVQHYGWRVSMMGAGAIALVVAGLLWSMVRDAPHDQPEDASVDSHIWQDVKILIKKPAAWLNGIYAGLVFTIITVFISLWAVPYFEVSHHLSLVKATLESDVLFVGVAIGAPLFGWLDSRIHHRRALLVGSSFVAAVLLGLIIYIPFLPTGLLMILMLLLGMVASSYVVTLIVASEIAPSRIRGTSIGFVNTLTVGTAPLFQPLIGLFLKLEASGQPGVPVYTVGQYEWALSILPALVLIAAFIAFYLPERSPAKL